MRKVLLALALLFAASPALAQNYQATAGSGLTFGAKSASSVLYPYFIGCDATTPTQCWAVDSSGRMTVNLASGSTIAATQGNAGSNAQAWWAQIGDTSHGPAKVQVGNAAGTTDLALTVVDPNLLAAVQGPIAAGTNSIGQVGSDPSSGKGTPSSVPINISTATTTQLVAASGTTSIYVTSFDVVAGGTGNITFEYGTGTNCGTGTTTLTGAYNLVAQAGISKGNGVGTVLKVPAGNALCALTSAAVQMSGSVSYQQF